MKRQFKQTNQKPRQLEDPVR